MIEPNTKIKPILSEVLRIIPSDYLISMHFQKCLIRVGLDDYWKKALNYIKNNRMICPGENFDTIDAQEAITLICNINYDGLGEKNGARKVFDFVLTLLDFYHSYSKIDINVRELIEDFMLIGLSEEECFELNKFQTGHLEIGFQVPDNLIKESNRIMELKEKIDNTIADGDNKLANTYCYTLLEGVFQGFCMHYEIEFTKKDKLTDLAKKVKEVLKRKLSSTLFGSIYAYNQITNIANIVYESRNRGSESHFDRDSDIYTSTFIRDMAFSLTNLLIDIIKKDNAPQKENM